MDIKDVLRLWFTNFLIKKNLGCGIKSMPNQQLAVELHKPIIRQFLKKKGLFCI